MLRSRPLVIHNPSGPCPCRVLVKGSALPLGVSIAYCEAHAAAIEILVAAKNYLGVIQGDMSPEANALRAAISKADGGK